MQTVRFARSARKHRIGRAHAWHVINTAPEVRSIASTGDVAVTWIGADDRDLELEIVAIVRPDCLLVIHVMPTALRTKDAP